MRNSKLGVDWSVELQLWRHKNGWGGWLRLWTYNSRTAIYLEVGEIFQKGPYSGVGCGEPGLYPSISGSGRGIQKRPGKSISRLQMRWRNPSESQLSLNIGDAGMPFSLFFSSISESWVVPPQVSCCYFGESRELSFCQFPGLRESPLNI